MKPRRIRLTVPTTWRAAIWMVALGLLSAACSGSTDLEIPDGAQELPAEHTVARLIADDATDEEVVDAAFTCRQGGSSAGPIGVCLVTDDSLLVILPLTMPSDVAAVVTGSGLARQFRVPMPSVSGNSLPNADGLFAVPHEQGTIEVEFHYNDEPSGAGVGGRIEP